MTTHIYKPESSEFTSCKRTAYLPFANFICQTKKYKAEIIIILTNQVHAVKTANLIKASPYINYKLIIEQAAQLSVADEPTRRAASRQTEIFF